MTRASTSETHQLLAAEDLDTVGGIAGCQPRSQGLRRGLGGALHFGSLFVRTSLPLTFAHAYLTFLTLCSRLPHSP